MLNFKRLNRNELIVIAFIIIVFLYKLFILYIKGALLPPDSYHYIQYSEKILNFDFASPDAIRTPGYPLFISIFSFAGSYSLIFVVISQMILGLTGLYFLYKVFDGSKYRSIILISFAVIYISPVSFSELEIITESLSFFLTAVFLFWLFKRAFNPLDYILFILTLILLVLTRPQFGIILFLLGFILLFKEKKIKHILIMIIAVLTVCLYSYFNYLSNNYMGMTSLLSFNLLNHTGYYIEKARDLNPRLVDIYIQHRDKRMVLNEGRQEFTFGDCKDTLMKTLNMDYVQLSKELDRINFYLITNYPGDYINTLKYSMNNLFNYDFYNYKITRPARYMIMITNILFAFGLLLSLMRLRDEDILTRSLLIIFYSSILLSVFLDTGETFRHIIPVSFISYIFLFQFLHKYINAKRSRENKKPVPVS